MLSGLGPWTRRRSDVIRLFSIEVALFLAPFVAYALFLWAAREGVVHPAEWSIPVLAWLSLVAVVLTAGGFAMIAEYGGAPAHSTYVPAHVENGKLVPGTLK
jgi:hypothetical protein